MGENVDGGYAVGGRSDLEEVDDPLDLVRARLFKVSNEPMVGEGNGVISSIAAICGDDITEPGDKDPALE